MAREDVDRARARRGSTRRSGPAGSVGPASCSRVRHDAPVWDVEGTTVSPDGFGMTTSIGASNSVTAVPARPQNAVTSTSWLPGSRPGPTLGGGGDRSIRSTTKSCADGRVGHAAGGSVTLASEPGATSVESAAARALSSTGGRSAPGVLSIVTATRNGVRVPLASSSSPVRTWRPSPSAPVAKVSVEPEIVGAGAAAPSSRTPTTVTGSLAVRTIWLGGRRDGAVSRSRRDEPRRRVVEADARRGRTERRRCRARRSRSRGGRRGRPRPWPVSNDVANGALVSEPISVQVPAPAGETPKATRAAEPALVALSATVPETTVPGSTSVTLGPVESTVTGTTAVWRVLPAASVTIARISVAPSGAAVASHVAWYGEVVSVATTANEPEPNVLTSNATDATPDAGVCGGGRELHRRAADDRAYCGSRDRPGGLGVVEARRPRCAGRRVAAAVRRAGAQVVEAVGQRCGREVGGEAVARRHVRVDRRPRARTRGAALEDDRGGVAGGGDAERDDAGDGGARIVQRHGRSEVVDDHGARRGGRLVAGDVGDDDAQVGRAVGERRRGERLAVGGADDRRGLRPEDRERARTVGLDLEADGRHARGGRDGAVGRGGVDVDRAGHDTQTRPVR